MRDMKKVVLSGDELAARLATALQTPGKMQYVVFENDQGQLVFPSPPAPVVHLMNVDSAGRVRANDASGRQPVVEQNSSTIQTNTAAIHDVTRYYQFVGFGSAPSGASTQDTQAQRRLFTTTLTATAGGEIVAAAVGPPALASFQGCMIIKSLWSDQTDASISMAAAATSGLNHGPATWVWGVTANSVTEYSPGVIYQATADNEAINFSCAAGQAQANQVIIVQGEYWYET